MTYFYQEIYFVTFLSEFAKINLFYLKIFSLFSLFYEDTFKNI